MSHPPAIPPSPAAPLRHHAVTILAGTAILVLLYLGREVLVPITLAGILSLLIAPLVRVLKRAGLGQVPAVLGAVMALTLLLVGLAVVIGTQVVSMAGSLPQYETTIRAKLDVVQAATMGHLQQMQGEAGRMMSRLAQQPGDADDLLASAARHPGATPGVVAVEIHDRPLSPTQLLRQVFASVWGPLGTAGIVLVVLIFVLLEHESLRDRFIRLTGGGDLRTTTHAFNDAGERLSRFFVSQFAVNCGVGAVIGVGLLAIGLPHWVLWAVITAAMRFVPYVGVGAAALSAALLGAAVVPGWSLMFLTLGLFAVVEIVASQAVEPLLYGHSTGLSPLSVVIAAIFWSWIWGPIGLLVSTPLTLCLVVAGRHVKALAFIDILLGDTPALTMSQRFYQRALSGDADETIAAAREYLKRRSLARYCDTILMPALRLAVADLASRDITVQQQLMVRSVIAQVIEALGPDARKRSRWHRQISVLDDSSLGLHLRLQRERAIGKWQGPMVVPPGSVVLCIGLGSLRDDLVTELLVRILRDLDIDARHLSVEDLQRPLPPEATVGGVAMVYMVSALPGEEWDRGAVLATTLRERFPDVLLVGLLPPEELLEDDTSRVEQSVDLVAHSFQDAVAHAASRYPESLDKASPTRR